jgi:hypothetical protein
MAHISLFIRRCSTWRTGRRFLFASITLLFACLFTPDLILRHIIAPRADFSRNGWWTYFSEPTHPVGIKGYKVFLPAAPLVALNPDFKKARGYMVWNVPVDSQYRIQFLAEDYGILAIDGKMIAELEPEHPEGKRAEQWVSLTKGAHLLQVKVQNDSGRGGFTIEVVVPPKMNTRHLLGADIDIAVPALYFLDFWWWIMVISHALRGITWVLTTFFALCLLLPLTLQNRMISIPISVVIALLPAMVIPVKVQREPYIGEMLQQELRKKNPDFVFIGNSMLWSRIDDAHLEKLLGGKRVYSIINFGGLSAVHYLSFKYLFLPADITPKRVFIFFRSAEFSLPRARTTNDPFVEKIIQRITPAPDPVYEQIVYGRSRSATDIVSDRLLRLFPVSATREAARNKLSALAQGIAFAWPRDGYRLTKGQPHILDLVNKRFSFTDSSRRSDLATESRPEEKDNNPYDFYGRVEDSFLPHILALAKEKNISLAFIRVQERPTEQGAKPDPPEMRKYMLNLREYLSRHGAALYDFTGDPELPLSAYHDGDHIKDQKKYTELFYRRVGDLLQ